ncbi:hypothetical protein Leryth_019745 [Lithospermum erythrorhizon]|nr:hypothetical protein Leryth_019745 [Lithospermum erythrorhizon]
MASRNKGSLMKPTFFLPEAEKIPSNMRNTHINNNGLSKQIPGRKSSSSLAEKAPCLNQMKRFASCHGGVLSEFDWKIAQIQGDDDMDRWKCNDQYSEEDEKFHFSAPLIMVGGRDDQVQELEPRKEVNLWRRRTIDQPKPLQIQFLDLDGNDH